MEIKIGNQYLSIVLILRGIILRILTNIHSFFFFFDFIKTSLFQITCTLMKYLHNHKNQSFKYLRFSNIIQNLNKN